jgi:hypothetical protein
MAKSELETSSILSGLHEPRLLKFYSAGRNFCEGGGNIYDGVDAPPTASMCQSGGVEHH